MEDVIRELEEAVERGHEGAFVSRLAHTMTAGMACMVMIKLVYRALRRLRAESPS